MGGLSSFSEYKFYRSFRIPVHQSDNLRFIVQFAENDEELDDTTLIDISTKGLGFSTKNRISNDTELNISLQFKKRHLDLTGRVVRAFSNIDSKNEIIYGVELEEEAKFRKFLELYLASFSAERTAGVVTDVILKEDYIKPSDGFEMFSLLLSLFKDITNFGNREKFLEDILVEVVRVLGAGRASLFLINPETNKLEANMAMGLDKDYLKFDYRMGIAGSVFTTGVALNIDTTSDYTRFNEAFDKKFGYKTKSIICYPFINREDKIVGVVEVLNKRNKNRFTDEDENIMKVLSLIFSSVFQDYNPISERSRVRKFSIPFNREFALIGTSSKSSGLRRTITRHKDLSNHMLIQGEPGVGKTLYANIIHVEGQRGINHLEHLDISQSTDEEIDNQLFGDSNVNESLLIKCQGGTLIIKEIASLSRCRQERLLKILDEKRLAGSVISLDVRIIATSSLELSEEVEKKAFNRDLYCMLNQVYTFIEPLRRRASDIPLLIDYFLKEECQRQGLLLKNFSPEVVDKFVEYDWPGNIEELRVAIERAVLYNPRTHIITKTDVASNASPLFNLSIKRRLLGSIPHLSDFEISLKDRMALVERELILAELRRHNDNRSKAAKSMGISREALRKKMLTSTKILESIEEQERSAMDKKAA
ncbi:MAG: sigma 54-interacting transcriptional regulator [Bdellovibrionales bacterium]|jgi:two-component system, NtrC family, response regulator HydG|nr:sigma 54-interacting transcriptional regulator [Bdellovibrionales bacterium]MBT3526962.1 sigma 54-interacting transcriptional regulator [Bdellovibrionales bacterium]MBT7669934.1 sigma 54-interacting transcriptional regulator [Bdellovibrionales bacterium]MBT7766184.1 sigma 54-interacting transcriptional regulator [Bdellovibrionales bacterium]